MTAIQNSPVQNNQSSIMRAATTGAIVGGALKGAGEYIGQKVMFKNADNFVKQIDESVVVNKEVFSKSGVLGEALENGLKYIDDAAQKAKDFVTAGKIDFGNVAKQAGRGALKIGLLCAGFAAVGSLLGKAANAKKAE